MTSLVSPSVARLAPELDRALRERARVRRIEKGLSLYAHGSAPDAIFCLEQGLIRLSATAANGREAILSLLEPGQWFGELSLLSKAPRLHHAIAVVTSDVLVLPASEFHDVVDQNPAFLRELLRLVCSRYKSALERVDAITLFPLPVRLARRLLSELDARAPGGSVSEVALKVSQENLGQMLGVTRQSINRQLREWEAQEIVRLRYGSILVVDQIALRRLAGSMDD